MRVSQTTRRLAGALAVLLAAAACSSHDLLEVKTPNAVPVDLFESPVNATLMANSTIGDFECAYGAAVLIEGIISDELADAQLGAAQWPYDRRDANTQTNGIYGTSGCNSAQGPGLYTPLATARWAADNALAKLNAWTDAQVPNRTTLIAQMNLYAGFAYAMLGMSMCNAAFDLGPSVDQKGMFALAEKRFGAAIAAAGTTASLANLVNAAYVGRARVRLFQGNLAGAAADAALVPKGFVLNVGTDAGASRRYNKVFWSTENTGNYTVEPGSLALKTENGEPDPRAAVRLTTTRPADSKSVIYGVAKYTSFASAMPLARYEEAQLVLAEAKGGADAVTIVNALRAAASLKPYTGATDAASIRSLVIDERRRVLFVEGFRNYDIQRFNLPLSPATGTTYPRVGGTYGTTTCLPLPDIERFNNPNITQ